MRSLLITVCLGQGGGDQVDPSSDELFKMKKIKPIDSSITVKPYTLTSHYTWVVLQQHARIFNLTNKLSHQGALADRLHLELISAGVIGRYVIKIVVTNIKLSFSSLKVRQKEQPALAIIASPCLFVAKELDSTCCFKVKEGSGFLHMLCPVQM